MIRIVQGPIRSGKTFYAVDYLGEYCKYNELYDDYKINDDVLIISNIEGLRLKHWDLDKCINKFLSPASSSTYSILDDRKKAIEKFFTIENFEAIQAKTKKNHIILIIDEAHKVFPADFKSNDVYNFFAESGHIGIDIFLLTQGIERLTRIFNPLLEFIVKVTPRSKTVLKLFMYDYTDLQGKYLYGKTLTKKASTFRMYKSFRVDEKVKPKNAVLYWVGITVSIFVVSIFFFKSALNGIKEKSDKGRIAANDVKNKTSVPVSPVAVVPGSSQLQPVMNNYSGLRVLPVIPLVPVVAVASWTSYNVEAYIQSGNHEYFMVNGQYLDSRRCRNYNRQCKTVDYYSAEKIADKKSVSSGSLSIPQTQPLQTYQDHGAVVPSAPEYQAIPLGTDIKTASILKVF